MAAKTFSLRQGDDEPISITLKDGLAAADITGYLSISVFFRSKDGAIESEGSTADSAVTVTSASSGVIALHPAELSTPLEFSKEYYTGYIVVEDSSGLRSSFPSSSEFIFRMFERFSGDAE